jgi:sugar/nucleoside kinase (ribokinase family)
VLREIDALFVSDDEMALGNAGGAEPALKQLAAGRLRYAVWRRGARGGLLFDAAAARIVEWRARAEQVVDPTGAGDAFAGGLISGWLAGETTEAALERGAVSASFAIGSWGAGGLFAATHVAAAARRRDWYGA